MDFNPNQMRDDALMKDGDYSFTVLDAREVTASTGTEMLMLKLRLKINSRDVQYKTNLFLTPSMFWQMEHFCDTTGMPDKIIAGRLMAQDCLGKEGIIRIGKKMNKDTGRPENITKDFIKDKEIDSKPESVTIENMDDDLQFN